MKFYLSVFFTVLFFTVCRGQITVNFDVKGGKPFSEITLEVPDSLFSISVDSMGRGSCSLVLDKKHYGYGRLFYGFYQVGLFLYKDFDCSVLFRDRKMVAAFSGEGKLLNEFVTTYPVVDQDIYKLGEQEFMDRMNKRYADCLKELDRIDFPAEFKKTEQLRQKYTDDYVVYNYASNALQAGVTLSPAYYRFLESYLIDDPDILKNRQTQSRLLDACEKNALVRQRDYLDGRVSLGIVVNYALEKFRNPAIRSYLVNALVLRYAERHGVEKLGSLKDTFDRVVTDPEGIRKLGLLYTQDEKIRPGTVSPDFTYNDINGNPVSLSSLRGRYVYIDVWATWCPPCCKQIPHMAELEHKYKDKNIHFVSISLDQNHKAWQNMVRERNMQGIQLNAGKDKTFTESYMISGIPRFILLDPEGRIVNAKMPVPSDPKTIGILDALKGM